MFSAEYNLEVAQRVRKTSETLARVARIPVIESNEEAADFIKGIDEISKLPAAELARLEGLTPSQLEKDVESVPLKTAVVALANSLKMASDATAGRAHENLLIQDFAKRKDWGTGFNNFERAVVTVDELSSMMQTAGIDASYMLAYRSVDASGREEMAVRDILGEVRFYELLRNEEVILTSTGNEKGDTVGFRRFGGGFEYSTYGIEASAVSVNDMLAGMRVASMRTKAAVAYREIFRHGSGRLNYGYTAWKYAGTDVTTEEKTLGAAYGAIHTLNEAARQMIEAAVQVASGTKKGEKGKTEAALPVTASSPILVYYNHSHNALISLIQRIIAGPNGINPTLNYNFVFVPTHLAPASAGWESTGDNERDDYGIFGKVKEAAAINKAAVRLVIPGIRNLHGTFQGLSFSNETKVMKELVMVGAFERYTFVTDNRQSARVQIEA